MHPITRKVFVIDYERYVRLFILLLLAFFFLAHIGTSYLLHQAKNRLRGEQESRLLFLSEAAAQMVKPGLLATGEKGTDSEVSYTPGTDTFMALEDLRVKGNLYRLLCWDRKGRIFFSSFAAPPSSPPLAWQGLSPELQAVILKGNPYVSDFIKGPNSLILRSSYFPIKDKKGEVWGVINAQEDSRFIRSLEKLSPWVQGFVLLATLSLLLFSALFLQQVFRPYRQLSRAAKEARQLPTLLGSKTLSAETTSTEAAERPQDEVEVIIKTFQEMIDSLTAKEAELRLLHSQAQERADRFEALYRYTLESMSSGVVGFDLETKITIINPWAQNLLGLDPAATLGKSCREIFGEEYEPLLRQSLGKGVILSRQELPFHRPGGSEGLIWLGLASMPMRDHKGQTMGATFLLTDITGVKKLQEELKIKERFAAIGEVSAGIAHELRNSLGAIAGFSQLLARKLPPQDPKMAHLEDIQKEVSLLEKFTSDFLSFARALEPQFRRVNLAELVHETIRGLPLPWEEKKINITVGTSLSDFNLKGDPLLLRQALHNLLLNAYQALEQGGQVILEAKSQEDPWGSRVVLSVKDNGPGIPASSLDKIFFPFFTTKRTGMGLGLALAKKILLAHGGEIEVKSEEGRGTEFLLYLPAPGNS